MGGRAGCAGGSVHVNGTRSSAAQSAASQRLAGWGNYPTLRTELAGGDVAALGALVRERPSLIARGNGRSYGDSTLNAHCVASTLALNRILAFDREHGRVTAEAGVMLGDLLEVLIPAGWFVPVTPGTRHVTLGGMLAADVHGKRPGGAGFGAHVEAFTLLLASGEAVHVDPASRPELFHATVGGMGLTGVVLDLTFRLTAIETPWIVRETVAAAGLDALLDLFAESHAWPYAVAWIDCLASGAKQGRSLFQRARHARADERPPTAGPTHPPERRRLRVPIFLPSGTLNGSTVRLFNAAYYRLGRARAGHDHVDYRTFFYPLDHLVDWNRIYGRRGFVQYQCVLPAARSRTGLRALLDRIGAARRGSFLAVLKRLGTDESGYLAFPMDGYTLALDFPMGPGVLALLDELDRIVRAHEGRLYLAKDARCPPAMVEAGYPSLERFRAVRQEVDPQRRFNSLQAIRLGL